MYHDQGLPVLKHAGFGHAVNVTLGLPYLRARRSTTARRSISPAPAARTPAACSPRSRLAGRSAAADAAMIRAAQALRPALPARPGRASHASSRRSTRSRASAWSRSARASARSRCRCSSAAAARRDRDRPRPDRRSCSAHCGGARRAASCTQGDVLEFDFAALRGGGRAAARRRQPAYNISTPLLFHLLASRDAHRRHALHAAEGSRRPHGRGARRQGLRPADRDARRGLHARNSLFRVGRGAFQPPPAVDSAVVRLSRTRPQPFPLPDAGALRARRRGRFSMRRKTLRNALRGLVDGGRLRRRRHRRRPAPGDAGAGGFARLAARPAPLAAAIMAAVDEPVPQDPAGRRSRRQASSSARGPRSRGLLGAELSLLHVVEYVPVEPMGETLLPAVQIEEELVHARDISASPSWPTALGIGAARRARRRRQHQGRDRARGAGTARRPDRARQPRAPRPSILLNFTEDTVLHAAPCDVLGRPPALGRAHGANATEHPVTVDVDTRYLEDQSDPDERRYVFAYTITIRNAAPCPPSCSTRHWVITDANGKVQEVRGEGVVGEQPHLMPGQGFRYSSGAVLETPVGCDAGLLPDARGRRRALRCADPAVHARDPRHDPLRPRDGPLRDRRPAGLPRGIHGAARAPAFRSRARPALAHRRPGQPRPGVARGAARRCSRSAPRSRSCSAITTCTCSRWPARRRRCKRREPELRGRARGAGCRGAARLARGAAAAASRRRARLDADPCRACRRSGRWTQAEACAREVERALRERPDGDARATCTATRPIAGRRSSQARTACASSINCLTRLRFVDRKGRLLLAVQGHGRRCAAGRHALVPAPASARPGTTALVFGHWSALGYPRGAGPARRSTRAASGAGR